MTYNLLSSDGTRVNKTNKSLISWSLIANDMQGLSRQ